MAHHLLLLQTQGLGTGSQVLPEAGAGDVLDLELARVLPEDGAAVEARVPARNSEEVLVGRQDLEQQGIYPLE